MFAVYLMALAFLVAALFKAWAAPVSPDPSVYNDVEQMLRLSDDPQGLALANSGQARDPIRTSRLAGGFFR